MGGLVRRLRDLLVPSVRDREMAQELETHLEALADEYRQAGLSADEARLAARRRFGSVASIKDRGHDVRGAGWLDDSLRELRHAARRLWRAPSFTLAAVATLALAIGANAAIFTVVYRVVLNPLPYPESDRLVQLDHMVQGAAEGPVTTSSMPPGLYHQYADRARTLAAVALYQAGELTITGDGAPERIRITRATPSLASVLQVPPALGRWFTDAEGVPGAPQVAVLSHGLWTRRYGGDPGILGRTLTIDGLPTEVVGVMPPAFAFPDRRVDLWIARPLTRATGFGLFSDTGVARLGDGVTTADARAEMTGLIADLPQAYPDAPLALALANTLKLTSMAATLKDATIGRVAHALWVLLASVGLVLLVACANVANLFVVRFEVRQREVALRRALGAGGAGIARYFLAESVLLSVAGGVAGLALAWGAVRLLVALGPVNLPRLDEVRLDTAAVAFTLALIVLASLAFAAMPLLRGAPLAASLHESGRRNTASRSRHRVRHLLMSGQVALAFVLLASSGLMVRSFQKLRAVDTGFDASSTLTFRIGLPERDYPTRASAVATHQAILDRLSVLPGVAAVSVSTCLPLADTCMGNVLNVEGRVDPQGTFQQPLVAFRAVAAGHVEAMGMRLLRGRGLDRRDIERGEPVVVINQALVHAYFGGQDSIGTRVRSSSPEGNLPWLTVVGIVSDTPTTALAEASPRPKLYMPMSIAGGPDIPVRLIGPSVAAMNYVVRSATSPLGLLPSVRRAVDMVDGNLALAQVRTLQDILDDASAQIAFTMVLLVIAAAVALMLGLVGIYGVVSYVVSQRTNEIGVRLALGAEPRGVAAMIVRQGGLVAGAGLIVGLVIALAGSRLIESLLYDVSPRDPAVFAVTTIALFGVALLTCWLPARRAARISPVEALRAE